MRSSEDPYRAAHKAIRVALGRLVESAGRVDFGDAAAIERFRVELEDVVGMLGTHARLELQYVDPLLGTHDHASSKSIQIHHVTLERELHAVNSGIDEIDDVLARGGDPDEARERGHAFYLNLTRFMANYFRHLADEEEHALPVLRRHVEAAVIHDALGRARASVEPSEAARMTAQMLASMSPHERVEMLRASGSDEHRAIARAVLSPGEWRALAEALDE